MKTEKMVPEKGLKRQSRVRTGTSQAEKHIQRSYGNRTAGRVFASYMEGLDITCAPPTPARSDP